MTTNIGLNDTHTPFEARITALIERYNRLEKRLAQDRELIVLLCRENMEKDAVIGQLLNQQGTQYLSYGLTGMTNCILCTREHSCFSTRNLYLKEPEVKIAKKKQSKLVFPGVH